MKIPMISTLPHLYAGKRHAVGDAFEATGRSDAKLLLALGRAVEAPLPTAAAEPSAAAPEPAAKTKRTYTRRVLTAEAAQPPAATPQPHFQPPSGAQWGPVIGTPIGGPLEDTYARRDLEAEQ
jgi:hypothetical protein